MPDESKAGKAPRELGPFEPTVWVPPPKVEVDAPFPAEPEKTEAAETKEPFVTEGMKARRRDEERRRKEELLLQLQREEKRAEGWQRIRGWALKVGLAAVLVLAYGRIQAAYPDNRWPLELVWALIVVGVFGVFCSVLWYLNRGD